MTDDYLGAWTPWDVRTSLAPLTPLSSLARSGAKDLVTRAIASLLEVRTASPVLFLAHQFDTSANAVGRSVRALRLYPPHGPAFQDAIYEAFRLLNSSSPSEASLIEAVGSSGTAVVPRRTYEDVVMKLIDDLPVQMQHRVFDAVCSTKGASSEIRISEFQRGVQICVLLEELFDVVEELFRSVDKSDIGEVNQAFLLSALENAAQQSKQRDIDDQSLLFVRMHLLSRHDIPDLSAGGAPAMDTAVVTDPQKCVRLVDLQEVVYQAVFMP